MLHFVLIYCLDYFRKLSQWKKFLHSFLRGQHHLLSTLTFTFKYTWFVKKTYNPDSFKSPLLCFSITLLSTFAKAVSTDWLEFYIYPTAAERTGQALSSAKHCCCFVCSDTTKTLQWVRRLKWPGSEIFKWLPSFKYINNQCWLTKQIQNHSIANKGTRTGGRQQWTGLPLPVSSINWSGAV